MSVRITRGGTEWHEPRGFTANPLGHPFYLLHASPPPPLLHSSIYALSLFVVISQGLPLPRSAQSPISPVYRHHNIAMQPHPTSILPYTVCPSHHSHEAKRTRRAPDAARWMEARPTASLHSVLSIRHCIGEHGRTRPESQRRLERNFRATVKQAIRPPKTRSVASS